MGSSLNCIYFKEPPFSMFHFGKEIFPDSHFSPTSRNLVVALKGESSKGEYF